MYEKEVNVLSWQYTILSNKAEFGETGMSKPTSDILLKFYKQVGANIRGLRLNKGFSQEQLGLECGLTRMNISDIELGKNITTETILKLALALGVNPAEIIEFDTKVGKNDLESLVNNNRTNRLKAKKKNPDAKVLDLAALKREKNEKALLEAMKQLKAKLNQIRDKKKEAS